MMTFVLCVLVILSVTTAAFRGTLGEVTTSLLHAGEDAVDLCLVLAGNLCLWSGLMKVAEKSGLAEKMAHGLYPITKRIFRGLKRDSPECRAISLNLAANLLGLGNAATPAGITAIQEMQKSSAQKQKGTATNHMVLFVVMNTASLQIIPTTTAMLRIHAGSATPMDVLPAIWFSSILSVAMGIAAAKALQRVWSDSPQSSQAKRRAE